MDLFVHVDLIADALQLFHKQVPLLGSLILLSMFFVEFLGLLAGHEVLEKS